MIGAMRRGKMITIDAAIEVTTRTATGARHTKRRLMPGAPPKKPSTKPSWPSTRLSDPANP